MKFNIETSLVVLLAVTATGIYTKLALDEDPEATAPQDHPLEIPEPLIAPEATALTAVPLSGGLPDHGHWRGKPILADLNHDGELDLAVTIRRWASDKLGEGLYVWNGDGQGNWELSIEGIRRDMGYGGTAVADIDGDGNLDLASSGHDVAPQAFFGDGAGSWTNRSDGIAVESVCSDVAIGDIDGDGIGEMATMGFFADAGGLYVFRYEDGMWNFVHDLVDSEQFGSQVRMLDVTGDGTDEIIATTSAGPKVFAYENGEFIDMSAGLPKPEVGGSDLGIDSVDLDGDGFGELLVGGMIYEGHAPLRLYDWNGNEWVAMEVALPDDEAFFDVEFAQIDGAGPLEIVAAGKHGITIAKLNEAGAYERLGRIENTYGVIHLTTGDINHDGQEEIVFVGFNGVQVLSLPEIKAATL